MIDDACGRIDYEECGAGPTLVLVPGSCSTGAAWRPVIAAWKGRFRCVTTSLPGYGGTADRRTARDGSIDHEAAVVESVIRRAGGRVHLVGHSFGGLVSLIVALRERVPLASLTIVEAPAMELLRDRGEHSHYDAVRGMSDAYLAAFEAGQADAISTMIDFYGGAGTFASLPASVRDYAVKRTPVNVRDWASAYATPLTAVALASVDIPVLVLHGEASHPAIRRANALLNECLARASLATVAGAAHFMIATHPDRVAWAIAEHAGNAETCVF